MSVLTTVDNKVSVKAIAKTFASGKTEKLVYEKLAELELPCEKVCLLDTVVPYCPRHNFICLECVHGAVSTYV